MPYEAFEVFDKFQWENHNTGPQDSGVRACCLQERFIRFKTTAPGLPLGPSRRMPDNGIPNDHMAGTIYIS